MHPINFFSLWPSMKTFNSLIQFAQKFKFIFTSATIVEGCRNIIESSSLLIESFLFPSNVLMSHCNTRIFLSLSSSSPSQWITMRDASERTFDEPVSKNQLITMEMTLKHFSRIWFCVQCENQKNLNHNWSNTAMMHECLKPTKSLTVNYKRFLSFRRFFFCFVFCFVNPSSIWMMSRVNQQKKKFVVFNFHQDDSIVSFKSI